MPAEDDSKQETENIHLFQMQGADYTNSKHFALKPEPDSYDLFQQWTYVEQHLQQRQLLFNTADSHYWNEHGLKTGITNASSIPVAA